MKLHNNKNVLFFTIFVLIFSCYKKSNNFKGNTFWGNYKIHLQNNDIDYLVKNSLDSIKCIDCFKNEVEKLYSSKFIFENYKNEFYNKKKLDKKEYSVYKNDSIIRINYSFENRFGDESHNTIYMFDKIEGKFLLTGMITVP
jgi:hypothetical protein